MKNMDDSLDWCLSKWGKPGKRWYLKDATSFFTIDPGDKVSQKIDGLVQKYLNDGFFLADHSYKVRGDFVTHNCLLLVIPDDDDRLLYKLSN